MTIDPIHFALDDPATNARLEYRPWGTRTLKVKVTTGTATPKLRLRPKNVDQGEVDRGVFRAYADDSEAFVISWGGGHEPGPCIKAEDFLVAFEKCAPLEPDDGSMIFFNLSHVGEELPETATVTLQAYEEKANKVARVHAELPITLKKPTNYTDGVARFVRADTGVWRPISGQPMGSRLPAYDPRWWPRQVSYQQVEMPPLGVQISGDELLVQWDLQPAAVIVDHTDPTILNENDVAFELFHFDEWHVALRVWFFWVDKNLGNGFFIGRHEVPDAERFDMLIRKRDGRVTLACTDLHWREMWGYLTVDEPLRATLGMSRETKLKLAEEKIDHLFGDGGPDHTGVHNPIKDVEMIAKLWYGREIMEVGALKAKGTEAHLPMIHNVEQFDEKPSPLTSSDVRLG